MIALIIALVLAVVILGGGLFALKRQISSSVGVEKDNLVAEIPKTIKEAQGLLGDLAQFASRPQLAFVLDQLKRTQEDLQKEKDGLKSIEARLDQAQKNVEQKEAGQQDLKTAKEEDENQLLELMSRYETISAESVSLEQKLAASLKNLDRIMNEVELSQDQKAVLQELSNAMTEAGSRLRDLLMEYSTVNDRLKVLQTQFSDLEEEYTRLVEQQLGE